MEAFSARGVEGVLASTGDEKKRMPDLFVDQEEKVDGQVGWRHQVRRAGPSGTQERLGIKMLTTSALKNPLQLGLNGVERSI